MKRYLSLRACAAGEGPVSISSSPRMIQEALLSPGCTLAATTYNLNKTCSTLQCTEKEEQKRKMITGCGHVCMC